MAKNSTLKKLSCDQCEALYINGYFCHETGCQDAWKTDERECKWCGSDFTPDSRWQMFCDESCAESYA